MSSLAISSVPSSTSSGTGAEATSADADTRFDDALRQTRQPQARAGGDAKASEDAGHARPGHDDAPNSAAQDQKPSQDDVDNATIAAPVVAAAVPAGLRQPLAATGKYVPTDTPSGMTASAPHAATAGRPPLLPGASPGDAQAAPSVAASLDPTLPVAAKPGIDGDAAAAADGVDTPSPTPRGLADFATQLAHVPTPRPGPAGPNAPAPAQLSMQASPGQPQFAQEAAQHVSWLVGQDIKQARIQLNPRDLGPIHIEISTHHDRVDVSFAAQHPQTVHALQQTLPQLHDMLNQQGLNLGQASVGQQAPDHQQDGQRSQGDLRRARTDDVETLTSLPSRRPLTRGRVDDFA